MQINERYLHLQLNRWLWRIERERISQDREIRNDFLLVLGFNYYDDEFLIKYLGVEFLFNIYFGISLDVCCEGSPLGGGSTPLKWTLLHLTPVSEDF